MKTKHKDKTPQQKKNMFRELFTSLYDVTLFSHTPMHTRLIDPYAESMTEKSIPHHCPCRISVAIFRISYRRRTASQNVSSCRMTSEFSFWARSVTLTTLFQGKPPRQFTTT